LPIGDHTITVEVIRFSFAEITPVEHDLAWILRYFLDSKVLFESIKTKVTLLTEIA